MINITKVMEDTAEVRTRMWELWDSMQKGRAKGTEVKNQIAVANVILNGHKVDIAAAHFMGSNPVIQAAPRLNGNRRSIGKQ